jgi:hypothetical protein
LQPNQKKFLPNKNEGRKKERNQEKGFFPLDPAWSFIMISLNKLVVTQHRRNVQWMEGERERGKLHERQRLEVVNQEMEQS